MQYFDLDVADVENFAVAQRAHGVLDGLLRQFMEAVVSTHLRALTAAGVVVRVDVVSIT
jgi:hypothetical protein